MFTDIFCIVSQLFNLEVDFILDCNIVIAMEGNSGGGGNWSHWVVCGGISGYCGLEWAGGGVLAILPIK